MAIIFMDGFDHYPIADIIKKWSLTGGSSGTLKLDSTIKKSGAYSLQLDSSGGGNKYLGKIVPNLSTIVVGFWVYTELEDSFLMFLDGTSEQIKLRNNYDGSFSVYRYKTLLGTSTGKGYLIRNTSAHIQMKVVFSNTVGSIEVKVNRETILNLTGIDTCNTANEYCNRVYLHNESNSPSYFDNFWIDDTDFNGDLAIETLYPIGAGDTQQWTPSANTNYECISEVSENGDTDYIETANFNSIDTYEYSNLSSNGAIKSVQVNMMARLGEDGSNKIAPVVKPSSIDIIGVPNILSTTYMNYIQNFNINPDDSQSWEAADINNCKFGVKMVE